MKVQFWVSLATLGLVFGATCPAAAQDTAEGRTSRLAQCLVGSSTGNDRLLVARWVGASLASAPQLEGLVTVNEPERERIDRQMASLFQRLMTQDCLDEARPLFVNREFDSLGVAFQELGGAAIRELVTNPRADAAMQSFAEYVDQNAFAVLEASPKP